MKKILFAFAAVLSLVSCTKKLNPYDMTFSLAIEDEKIGYNYAWPDIIPSNNDFYYWFGAVSAEEFSKYGSDKEFISAKMKELWDEYERCTYGDITFETLELYRGAYFQRLSILTPDTDYYLLAFTVDESREPLDELHKLKFRTKTYEESDIDFELSLNGSVFTFTPSNNDSYFYDYLTAEELDDLYAGSPIAFHYFTIAEYEEYGFMTGQSDTGVATSDAADFYNLEEGDVLYVTASGYRYGITSGIKMWKATYNGKGKQGTIEEASDPYMDL